MFTRNWYKTLASAITRNSAKNFVNVNGEEKGLYSGNSKGNISLGSDTGSSETAYIGRLVQTYNGYGGVRLGTGDTPATVNDYKLSGNLITGYNFTVKIETQNSAESDKITATYTITNTSSSEITIKEVGIVAKMGNTTSTAQIQHMGLLERTVLDTPVTIPAGGVGQVVYTITFNYPTAI